MQKSCTNSEALSKQHSFGRTSSTDWYFLMKINKHSQVIREIIKRSQNN